MIKRSVTITNKLGLHARAAAVFVKAAASYESEIFLSKDEQRINGKSIMGVMMLAASQGTALELEIDGGDEERAMSDLVELIDNRFGEDE